MESVERGSVKICWFGRINLTLAKLSAGKDVTFQKHWNDKNKKTLEIKLGVRNDRGTLVKPPHEPNQAKVALCWQVETYSTSDGVFVPVSVPTKHDLAHVWKCDSTVTLTGDFLKNILYPALERLAA